MTHLDPSARPEGDPVQRRIRGADVAVPGLCPESGADFAALEPARGGIRVQPRHPLIEMLLVAAPTVVTMTSYTVMQFIDGLMVSRIGPDPIYLDAQGNGGLAAFVPIAMVMGLSTVINTFVAQNLGAGRPERGSAYAWAGLWICAVWAAALLPATLVLEPSFRWIGHSQRLVGLESGYARILLMGAFLTMATRSISHFFYGLHRPGAVMIAALVGNGVNVAVNYALIFGNWGLPEMGVAGAAIGTVVGSAVELSIPLSVFLSAGFNRRYATRRAWRPNRRVILDVLRLGWPAGLMMANEIICWAILLIDFIARFGDVHNAAGWIALRYMHLSFMPAVGISIAVTAIVGRCMGMGRVDLAQRRAWLGLGITCAYMGLCALAFVLLREQLVAVYIKDGMPAEQVEELIRVGSWVMILAGIFQVFDAIAISLVGALRGAGDTLWPGVATIALSWTFIVGGGYAFVVLAPGLESIGPWIGASAYIITLGLAVLGRFLGGKWKRIQLVDASDGRARAYRPAEPREPTAAGAV